MVQIIFISNQTFNLVINLVWFQFYVLTITIIVTYKLLSNCSVLYHCKVFVTEDFSNPIQNIHELLCFQNCDPWEDDDIVTSSLTQPRPPLHNEIPGHYGVRKMSFAT